VIKEAAKILAKKMQAGEDRHFAWNNTGVYLMRAAKVKFISLLFTLHVKLSCVYKNEINILSLYYLCIIRAQ